MSQAKRSVRKSSPKKTVGGAKKSGAGAKKSARPPEPKRPAKALAPKKAAKALAPKKAGKGLAPKKAAKALAPKKAAATVSVPGKTAKKAKSSKSAARPAPARRADLGDPIDGFFERQPAHLRPILEELRTLVAEVVPDATSSIKWGMPFYVVGRESVCALAGFKSHVNLILAGPPSAFEDPEGRLEGEAKIGRHLKLRSLDELPRDAVRAWLTTAAGFARQGAKG